MRTSKPLTSPLACLLVLGLAACTGPTPTASPATLPPTQSLALVTLTPPPRPTTNIPSVFITRPPYPGPPLTPTPTYTPTQPYPGPATSTPTRLPPSACISEQVPLTIFSVEPTSAKPGAEIRLEGKGGHIIDNCGFINESARTFTLYLDHQPIGDLLCYVTACQGTFTLPTTIAAGPHCLDTEIGECGFELIVK